MLRYRYLVATVLRDGPMNLVLVQLAKESQLRQKGLHHYEALPPGLEV